MVVFDASFLLPLLNKKASVSVPGAYDRVAYLYDQLGKAKDVIVIPTPALAEILVRADSAAPEYMRILSNKARFRIENFDTKAAVELSQQFADALATGDKRGGVATEVSRHKIKFDRQIIAIARATGSTRIYSDDPDFKTLVGTDGPQVISFAELPKPPEDAQLDIRFDTMIESEEDSADATGRDQSGS